MAQLNAADGTVASTTKYWPFGAERSGTAPERGYTGQQKEPLAPLGMYYYKARFYSTAIAHFVSADPLSADGLNRYAYVLNQPISFTDPTGLCIMEFECRPSDALNILACAHGPDGCLAVFREMGIDFDWELFQAAQAYRELP